jgi:hypothetical protein
MVAIAGDHRVLVAVERGLQADRNGFLADIEMAEAADETEAVELAGFFFEAADEQHLLVEFEQLLLGGFVPLRFVRAFAVGYCGFSRCFASRCFGHDQEFLVRGGVRRGAYKRVLTGCATNARAMPAFILG